MTIHPAASFGLVLLASVTAIVSAAAQDENPTTPGAIPNPGTYQGSMQLQQQEQQQYRQQEQQNQQMQQRLNQNYQQYAPGQNGRGGGGAPQVNWWSKPALPAARNPLLGRWRQMANRVSGSQNSFAGLLGGMLSGGCESMFGKGVVAFEPDSLQWVARDGHEEILNHVAYRSSGQDVVMISRDPGAIPALFFGFPNRDHLVVATFNCQMERLGAKPPSAAIGPGHGDPSAPLSAGAAKAVLNFAIGKATPGQFAPFSGIQIFVTREEPQNALVRAGVPVQSELVTQINGDCRDVTACVRDWKAMTTSALGSIRTDAAGHAQTPGISPGRYYLVGIAPYQGKHLFWHRQVDLKTGTNAVVLDQTNASVIN